MLKKLFNRSKTNAVAGSFPLKCGRIGLLRTFLRDKRANTAMIVAACLIPMLAVMGAGVDMARSYTVRMRLQQACDFGALAARRAMTGGTLTATNVADGQKVFAFNFPQKTLGTTIFTPTINISPNSSSTVVVTAKTTMPTTIMRLFAITSIPVSVKCEATISTPNNDVMFVLDTTGSMDSAISDGAGGTTTRLASLKLATKAFYDALGPGNNADGRIRYGFVPYVQKVNVGYLLKPEWLKSDDGYYSTRRWSPGTYLYYDNYPLSTTQYRTGATIPNPVWWHAIPNESNNYPVPATTTWAGCIEERDTVNTITANSSLTIPSNAYDLNIDLVPYNTQTQWQPYWPEVTFWIRGYDGYNLTYTWAVCPQKARKLMSYSSRSVAPVGDNSGLGSFDNYIDSLSALGGTQTDVGLMWGARLISGTGLFTSENSTAPNGFNINRNIVLMTDGALTAYRDAYSAYGINSQQPRVAANTASDAELTAIHNRRFEMICNAVKAKGIIIWVVAFDTTLTPSLANCATSSNHASVATSALALREQFKAIAKNIGGLRVSN